MPDSWEVLLGVCCNCSESDCAGLISIPQEFITFPEAQNVILFGNKAVIDIIRWDDILEWRGSLIHCEWWDEARHRARHTWREGMWRSRERMACDDRCGDGTDAAAGQEGQRGSNSQEPGRKARNDYPLKPSKSKWPCQHHDFLDSWPSELGWYILLF